MCSDPKKNWLAAILITAATSAACSISVGDGSETPDFYVPTDPPATDPPATQPAATNSPTPTNGDTPTLSSEDTPRPTEPPTATEIPTPRPDPEPAVYTFEATARNGSKSIGNARYVVDEAADFSQEIEGWTYLAYEEHEDIPLIVHTATAASLDERGALISATVEQAITLGTTALNRVYEVDGNTRTIHVKRDGYTITWQLESDPAPLALWPWESEPFFGYTIPDVGLAYIAARAKEVGRLEPTLAIPDFFSIDRTITGNGPCYTANERFCLTRFDGFLESITLTPVDGALNRLPLEAEKDPPAVSPGTTSLPLLTCPLPDTVDQREDRISRSPLPTIAVQYDVPAGEGPWPTALLMGDIGGQDRDWNQAGTPVARCLALALLERGIAVARFDDRGHGESGGAVEDTSFSDRTNDFRAVYDHLQQQSFVDPDQIFVVAHGEGAAHVAETFPLRDDIKGIAAIGTFTGTGLDLWNARTSAYLSALTLPSDFAASIEESRSNDLNNILEKRYLDTTFDGLSVDFWEEFLEFDATEAWGEVTAPVLIVAGALDWEVSASHATTLQTTLTNAGNSDVSAITYPNLGHRMSVPNVDPNIGQEYYLPHPWDIRVENRVGDWISSHLN